MRSLSALLPVLTLLVVAYIVLVVGAPRGVVSLRLSGGPTDRLARYSALLAAERDGKPFTGETFELFARSPDGQRAHTRAELDAEGYAEVALEFPRAPGSFRLEISHQGEALAYGTIQLPNELWRSRAQRRGGFFGRASQGSLKVSMAPGRGVFAVPFTAPLVVRVERAGVPVADAEIDLHSEGARIVPQHGRSDSRGLLQVQLTPFEHVVGLRVKAKSAEDTGELSANLPVAAGALFAARTATGLRVYSPIVRDSAFVAFLNQDGRLRGQRVALTPSPEGAESAEISLDGLPPGPLWARVSSEALPTGTSLIAWPLFETNDEPPLTWDVPDFILLDSSAEATRREKARRRRVFRLAIGVGLVGAFASILVVLLSARRSSQRLDAHLEGALGAEEALRVAPPAKNRSLISTVLIALGFLVLAALFAWRLGS
ncbi:MAG: hypothetical protein ACOY0T_12695 [Myxococcota bacterium]